MLSEVETQDAIIERLTEDKLKLQDKITSLEQKIFFMEIDYKRVQGIVDTFADRIFIQSELLQRRSLK